MQEFMACRAYVQRTLFQTPGNPSKTGFDGIPGSSRQSMQTKMCARRSGGATGTARGDQLMAEHSREAARSR
jgi:hypothetical protein